VMEWLSLLFYSGFIASRHLVSRRPLWRDTVPSNLSEVWCDSWESATVVDQSRMTDLTIRQLGYDLPRRTWCALNRSCTRKGLRAANLHKWGLASSDKCEYGMI